MLNYVYDGSFDGLMTAVYEAYYRHERPDGMLSVINFQESMLDKNVFIIPDREKSDRVIRSIREKICRGALEKVFYVFLSNAEDPGTLIYHYLELGWRIGSKINLYISDDRVLKVENICRSVLGESHRMLGLIRFKHLKGDVYYSAYEPDHNITMLIAPHFTRRLSCQDWIIHDVKRNLAAMYNKRNWIVTEFSMNGPPVLDEDEIEYQSLWRKYFNSAAINSRKNIKLQKRNMPYRYWKYLIEIF